MDKVTGVCKRCERGVAPNGERGGGGEERGPGEKQRRGGEGLQGRVGGRGTKGRERGISARISNKGRGLSRQNIEKRARERARSSNAHVLFYTRGGRGGLWRQVRALGLYWKEARSANAKGGIVGDTKAGPGGWGWFT
jgi:hypothetical protein